MKIVPVARKMRVVAHRGDGTGGHKGRLGRWAALLVVFSLTVLTTAPSLWLDPLPVDEGVEIDRPIHAARTFEYEAEDATTRWLARRSEEFTRIFVYDSAVRETRIARVRELRCVHAVGGVGLLRRLRGLGRLLRLGGLLRLLDDAQTCRPTSLSGFIARHIEQPASRHSKPAAVKTLSSPSASA